MSLEVGSMWDLFYAVIRQIPSGKVATYGAVAEWAGKPRTARHVGYALAAFKGGGSDQPVPWQRVVGARAKGFGWIAIREPIGAAIQQKLLEGEGVSFDARGRIDLGRFGWRGPRARRLDALASRHEREEERELARSKRAAASATSKARKSSREGKSNSKAKPAPRPSKAKKSTAHRR